MERRTGLEPQTNEEDAVRFTKASMTPVRCAGQYNRETGVFNEAGAWVLFLPIFSPVAAKTMLMGTNVAVKWRKDRPTGLYLWMKEGVAQSGNPQKKSRAARDVCLRPGATLGGAADVRGSAGRGRLPWSLFRAMSALPRYAPSNGTNGSASALRVRGCGSLSRTVPAAAYATPFLRYIKEDCTGLGRANRNGHFQTRRRAL
jgi:hypothetical protein